MAEPFNASYVGLRSEVVAQIPDSARCILDVGAADGTLGAALLARRPDRSVIGIEADPDMAAVASGRLSGVVQGDVATIEWDQLGQGTNFDCMVFADVLEHVGDPVQVLRSAVGRSTPGATILISLPNIRHVSAAWTIFVRGTFPRRDRGLFDRTHLRWFTTADAAQLCRSAGLRVERIERVLRIRDRPGGAANAAVRQLSWLGRVPLLGDLLTYQNLIVATPDPTSTGTP